MPTKLLIIGGVAGGASAAARARRLAEDATIILFERGEHVSFANCGLPYYIGWEIKNRDDLLVADPELLRDRFKIDVRVRSEVTAIDREAKTVTVKDLVKGEEYTETYDKIVLSPGAEPIRPPLPGIDLPNVFTLRSIPDADRILSRVQGSAPRDAVVVGGGFIGVEMAENLMVRGINVTIVEMLEQVLPPFDPEMAALVQAHLREKGVALHLGDGVSSFAESDGRTVVTTAGGTELPCDVVVLAIGVRPENALAKVAGLELGARGGIVTNARMQTSDPDIYAVGDAVEVRDRISGEPAQIPLAGPANRQGRIAADNVFGRESEYGGTLGTAVVKVFDMTAAATGSSAKAMAARGVEHLASYTHSWSHAAYYPGAGILAVKLMYAPDGGEILGAQIVGTDGADKRIDVLATAILAGMTVFDLEELELSYAPPFSSAKDPVNMAGFVAGNILRGDVEAFHWDEAERLGGDGDTILLDVRDQEELDETGFIPGAVNIPVNELRGRLDELDREKDIAVYCRVGQRGYIATRILTQNGFRARNLTGGMLTWMPAAAEKR